MIYLHSYKISKDIKTESKKLLKENLSSYLQTNKFIIENNENGKPYTTGIHFSISHSQDRLVQVFCVTHGLGVDVEYVNLQRKYLRLAKRYFHLQEYNLLKSLDNKTAGKLFYSLWTTKEAFCKAQGGRLWYYLQDNYLNENHKIINSKEQLNIMQFDEINNFSLSIATFGNPQEIKIIHE